MGPGEREWGNGHSAPQPCQVDHVLRRRGAAPSPPASLHGTRASLTRRPGCPMAFRAPDRLGGIFRASLDPRREVPVLRSTLVLAVSTLALSLPQGAGSAQQRAVTLAEALELAEKAAPRVVQATGNAGAAGWSVRAAWGEYLPRLTGGATAGTRFSAGPPRAH